MSYLDFVVLIVPAAIGLASAILLGPNRGTLLAGATTLLCVLLLMLFQVSTPEPGHAGDETSRFGYAYGLMMFEWYRWLPSLFAWSCRWFIDLSCAQNAIVTEPFP